MSPFASLIAHLVFLALFLSYWLLFTSDLFRLTNSNPIALHVQFDYVVLLFYHVVPHSQWILF